MARQVLPIVGAVIGAYFGNPQLGYMIGSIVGNAVDPLVVDGPKIGDVAQQTSSEGVYRPIVFGTAQIAGNIIAQGPNIIRKRKQQQGKGGGPITVTESLYKTFAIRLCESWRGEEGIVGISRIWENGKLVYDARPESTIVAESAEFGNKFRVYLGTSDQIPDPDLEAIYGIGNTPSYRGRAYVVFPLYDITAWKAIPQYQFEVVTGGTAVQSFGTIAMGARAGVADEDGYLALTSDGSDWGTVLHSEVGFQCAPVWSEGYWLAIGRTEIKRTDDINGQTGWTAGTVVTAGPNQPIAAAYLGNGVAIAVGIGGTIMRTADFGLTSNAVALPDFENYPCIIADGDGSAILGCSIYDRYVYTNTGGASFQKVSVRPMSSGADITCGYHNKNDWSWCIAGGTLNASPGELAMLASPGDEPHHYVPNLPSKVFGIAQRDFYHPDGMLAVAVCYNGEIVYSTNEWVSWTISSFIFPYAAERNLIFNGSEFIVTEPGAGGSDNVQAYRFTDPEDLHGPYPVRLENNISLSTAYGGLSVVTSTPPKLDQVVSWFHLAVGQPDSEFDVAELDEIVVDGLAVAGAYTAKDVINSLQGLWQFDSPEYDRKIHYHLRGKPVVRVFTFDDLLEDPEESTREQAVEYPKKAHLDYQSPKVDYAPAKATSSRSSQDARVVGEVSIQTAVVFNDPNVPAQRVQVMHKVFWADADGENVIYVPDQHLDLVPGDCIGLSLRGTLRRLRIDKMEISPGILKLTCRNDRETAYTSAAVGIVPPPPTPPPPSLAGPTMPMVLDTSLLRDADDGSALTKYIALGGVSPAWAGALLEESTNLGTNYSDLLQVSVGSVMGTLLADVGASSPHYFDRTNTIRVQLDVTDESIDIDSLTYTQFLNEGGAWAIQNADGSVEIGQYRDAVDLGGGLFELSFLQRGRLNTGAVLHPAGSRLVLLETVVPVRAPSAQLGVDVYYRATSFGRSTETGTVIHQVFDGNSQREWPVADVLPKRVDANTISVRIVPRHRLGTVMAPLRSLNHDGYHWLVTDGVNTIDHRGLVLTETFDVTGWSSPIEVSVAQVNRITQDGPAVTEEIA